MPTRRATPRPRHANHHAPMLLPSAAARRRSLARLSADQSKCRSQTCEVRCPCLLPDLLPAACREGLCGRRRGPHERHRPRWAPTNAQVQPQPPLGKADSHETPWPRPAPSPCAAAARCRRLAGCSTAAATATLSRCGGGGLIAVHLRMCRLCWLLPTLLSTPMKGCAGSKAAERAPRHPLHSQAVLVAPTITPSSPSHREAMKALRLITGKHPALHVAALLTTRQQCLPACACLCTLCIPHWP